MIRIVNKKAQQLTVGLRNVGFFGWKVSPPILLLSKEMCVAPKPTLLKPTAVSGHHPTTEFLHKERAFFIHGPPSSKLKEVFP